MVRFLKSHLLYMLIGFLIVILTGMGITIVRELRIRVSDMSSATPSPIVTADSSTPSSIPEPTTVVNQWPRCDTLSAIPDSGTVPFTASFSATAIDPLAGSIFFHFSFGDDTKQTVEKRITNETGTVEQSIQHTYTEPGVYTSSVSVENDRGQRVATACTLTIQAGGVARSTKLNKTITPSSRPSVTPRKTQTPITVVAVPHVPEAGNLWPTVLAGMTSLLIILIGIVL